MLIKIVTLSSVLAFSMGQFINGKCGKASISFSGLSARVQCNYNHTAYPEHFSYENEVLKLTAYTDDLPHSINAGGLDPRTEMTFSDSYGFNQSDTAEFEAYVLVPSGISTPFSLFQVKCGDGIVTTATTGIMLNFKDGKFQRYDSSSTVPYYSNIYDQWIRFKVVFRGPSGKIDVYYGDTLSNKITYSQNGYANTYYFKIGPYGRELQNSVHNKMEAWFKNIKITKNGKDVTSA